MMDSFYICTIWFAVGVLHFFANTLLILENKAVLLKTISSFIACVMLYLD